MSKPVVIRANKFGRVITMLSLAVSFLRCAADSPPPPHQEFPFDVRQRHPIAIREGDEALNLFIGINRGALLPAQRAQVLGFADSWKRQATGGIAIDLPAGTPNARAAADALPEVRTLLSAAGVPPRAVAVRSYQPDSPIKFATLRLRYPKMVAEAGPCGLWPRDIGPGYGSDDGENWPYWNFGCAYQRNLAAIIEDPGDLVQPRPETPPYAARRSTVFEKYRKGEDPTTNYRNTTQGKITDIGQQ
jgi:pilus assembly protein CpaD